MPRQSSYGDTMTADLQTELSSLRAELAALREEKAQASGEKKPESEPEREKQSKTLSSYLKPEAVSEELDNALKELTDLSEKEIAEHPMLAMGIVFAVGFLAGRATK
mgnify:CR=1 FL=1|tara:strand:- start:179 stop:499 length:321 start_codon:yes stop_codon:yes gene_type:complete